MEKILFGAYLSILAAFITAAASIVKLVNEKESKTTDYRQSWTDSVRKSLSQLIGSITLQATYIANREEVAQDLESTHLKKAKPEDEKVKDSVTDYLKDQLTDFNSSIRTNRECIQQNYALTALHFKPNDEVFIKIESKFETVNRILSEMTELRGEENNGERRALKEKIGAVVIEITETSRFILKTEWENVKRGEPAYKTTKNWALYFGISTFAILLVGGIYLLAVASVSSATPSAATKPEERLVRNNDTATERSSINQSVVITPQNCTPAISISKKPKVPCNTTPSTESSIAQPKSTPN